MKTKITLLMVAWMLSGSVFASKTPTEIKEKKQSTAEMSGIMKSQFVENKGQIADLNGKPVNDVLFYVKRDNAIIYFKADRVIWVFQKTILKQSDSKNIQKKNPIEKNLPQVESMEYQRVDMIFENTNENKIIESENAGKAKFNFYLPQCDKGALDVKTYSTIRYKNIYNNIDIEFRNDGDALKYNFILNPGADINNIKIKYDGADSINLNEASELEINTKLGKAIDKIPYSYILGADGTKQSININWALNNNEITYSSDKIIDKSSRVIIDPSIVFGYWGGVATTWLTATGDDIAADVDTKKSTGEFFIGGYTNSTNLPTITGYTILSNTNTGMWDGFVSKFDASGTLIWGTYYGGTDAEFITAIKCDQGSANVGVYATGYTFSTYLPFASGSKQDDRTYPNCAGGTGFGMANSLTDAFLIHFSESGYVYFATFYGNTACEYAYALETDFWGNIYIGGEYYNYAIGCGSWSWSSTEIMGGVNYSSYTFGGFVACFNSTGSFIQDRSVAYDNTGCMVTDLIFEVSSAKLIVCGQGTLDPTLLSTSPLQGTNNGNYDLFITKLTTYGSPLSIPSIAGTPTPIGTYFGGNYDEWWPRISVYPNPILLNTYNTDIYLAFTTRSDNMNALGYTNSKSYQANYGSSSGLTNQSDVFVAVLNSSLTTLKYGSYLGGGGSTPITVSGVTYSSSGEQLNDIIVDKYHNFYVYGVTDEITFLNSSSSPMADPEYPKYFLAEFNPDYSNNFIMSTQYANILNPNALPTGGWSTIATGGFNIIHELSRVTLNGCNDQILLSGSSTVLYNPGLYSYTTMHAFATDVDITPLFHLYQTGTLNYVGSPITLSIPSNPYIYGIQWYLNGTPIAGATGFTYTATVRGNYYATATDMCSNTTFTSNTVLLSTSCTDPSYTYEGSHTVYGTEYWTNQNIQFDNIDIPSGTELHITNCPMIASACGFINVQPGGKLYIDNSQLLSCDQWEGIILNNNSVGGGSSPQLNMSNYCSIEDAIVGIYATTSINPANDNIIDVTKCTFKNNCTHVFVSNDNGSYNKTFTDNQFLNLSLIPPNPTCGYDPVGAFYSIALPYNNQIMMSNVSYLTLATNTFSHTDNNQYNAILSTLITNTTLTANQFSGYYNKGISMLNNSSMLIFPNINVTNNSLLGSYQIGIELENINNLNVGGNTLNGASTLFPLCSNNIGIHMRNCETLSCQSNIISNFTYVGIEYYIDHQNFPTIISNISYNVINPTSEGLIVSYNNDPISNPTPNTLFFPIQLQIKCNGFHQCQYGIVGSGNIIDQINNGVPEDAGNVFHGSINWDIIWENSGIMPYSYFTYFVVLGYEPNTGALLILAPTPLNGTVISTNQFTINNTSVTLVASCRAYMKKGSEPKSLIEKIDNNQSLNVEIHPNPINNNFTISMNKVIADKIEIFDVLGRVIYSNNISLDIQTIDINSSNWITGVYFVKVYNNDKVVKSEKVLKIN